MTPSDAPGPDLTSLRPVRGTPREVESALRAWLGAGAGAGAGEPLPLVIRTSGSTGRPKDVRLSRRAVTASAHSTHARLGGPGQWLLDLPAQYVAGVQVIARSILAGTSPVVAGEHLAGPAADPDTHADPADRLEAAVAAMTGDRRYASLVPTQLHRLAESDRLGVLADLDAVLVGGAALDPALRARAQRAGVRIVRTYGMSETAGGCVYDGVPLDGVALRIDDERRVWIAGPVLFDGYDGDPDATADALRDGWLRTHDLGELDHDGRLRILGRTDDVVVSGGVNVALPRVAEALRHVPGVLDAAVVGVPDDEWGQEVVAVVATGATGAPRTSGATGATDATSATEPVPLATLRDGVEAAGLPRTWAPRRVVHVDALPLLDHGKVDRRAVLRLASAPGITWRS